MKKEKNLYSGFYFISGSININKNFAHDIENKINYVESVVISHNSDIHLIGLDICNNCFNLLIHSSYSYKLIKQIIFNDTEYYLSDGRMWEVLTARDFIAICLPDCTVMH